MTPPPVYFDISPAVSPALGVFPGDVPFQRRVSLDFANGEHLLLSSITTTLHLGAHADAPNHYKPGEVGIDLRHLGYYMGKAQVISAPVERGARVRLEDLKGTPIQAPRILFKTGSFPDPNRWNDDFAAMDPALIETMAQRGVRLIGIDTPSIDPQDSKLLEAHQVIARNDMAILEGLCLNDVPDGLYTLIALPLRLQGADASPVRAILLTDASLLTR